MQARLQLLRQVAAERTADRVLQSLQQRQAQERQWQRDALVASLLRRGASDDEACSSGGPLPALAAQHAPAGAEQGMLRGHGIDMRWLLQHVPVASLERIMAGPSGSLGVMTRVASRCVADVWDGQAWLQLGAYGNSAAAAEACMLVLALASAGQQPHGPPATLVVRGIECCDGSDSVSTSS